MLEKVDMSGSYVCPWVLLRSDCLPKAVASLPSAVNWGARLVNAYGHPRVEAVVVRMHLFA